MFSGFRLEETEALMEARRCLHCGQGAERIDRKGIRCLTCNCV